MSSDPPLPEDTSGPGAGPPPAWLSALPTGEVTAERLMTELANVQVAH